MKTSIVGKLGSTLSILLVSLVIMGMDALAQNGRMAVSFISVCSDGTVPGASGSCPQQTSDTHQMVSAPNLPSINSLTTPAGDLKFLADEHSTIFPPNHLSSFPNEYLFFVAGGGGLNVLASPGPDTNGHWTLHFAKGIGYYNNTGGNGPGYGPVFGSAMQKEYCPTQTDVTQQDPTFDLNYGAVGTVIKDPTNPNNTGPGNLMMIYEGTNRCVGVPYGNNLQVTTTTANGKTKIVKNSFYSTIGIATSNDLSYWPSYRYQLDTMDNLTYPLPMKNPCTTIDCSPVPTNGYCTPGNPCYGPNAANGALNSSVCVGNACTTNLFCANNVCSHTNPVCFDSVCTMGSPVTWPPDPNYGRYPIFSPPESLTQAIQNGKLLKKALGYQAPSAFLDDVRGDPFPNVYVVAGKLDVTRGQLNGGTGTLKFKNWYRGSFADFQPGIGGMTSSISFLGPQGYPENCEAGGQHRTMASFSYLEATQQYLLTFVCMSSLGDPLTQSGGPGAAWFYSTNPDLSHQDHWSAPQEIVGSWVPYDAISTKCSDYDGWYPSFMSPNNDPGHLATNGYTFYMHGCTGGFTPGGRQFSTRAFTINLKSTRTFQGMDAQQIYVLGTNATLWFEQSPFGSTPRTEVDTGIATFQAIPDGNVFVLDLDGNLFFDSPHFGTVTPARQQVDYSVRSFQAVSSQTVFVLGNDGSLWLEYAPFGSLPPFRQAVDFNVRDFHALDANRVLVLGTDGNLWLEQAPFGTVPPARVQVDGNVLAFQKAPGSDEIFVLGTDGSLWLEQPPFGQVPPTRVQVDGNVSSFQALDASHVFVLGSNGKLWLEYGPFGTVPPTRQQVDSKTRAFQALDLLHVYVLDIDENLWLEQAPFGTVQPNRQQVDGSVM